MANKVEKGAHDPPPISTENHLPLAHSLQRIPMLQSAKFVSSFSARTATARRRLASKKTGRRSLATYTKATPSGTSIGWIGTGVMGKAMCEHMYVLFYEIWQTSPHS